MEERLAKICNRSAEILRGRIWLLRGGDLYSILKRTKEILSGR